jgi:hypothetical protein
VRPSAVDRKKKDALVLGFSGSKKQTQRAELQSSACYEFAAQMLASAAHLLSTCGSSLLHTGGGWTKPLPNHRADCAAAVQSTHLAVALYIIQQQGTFPERAKAERKKTFEAIFLPSKGTALIARQESGSIVHSGNALFQGCLGVYSSFSGSCERELNTFSSCIPCS